MSLTFYLHNTFKVPLTSVPQNAEEFSKIIRIKIELKDELSMTFCSSVS